MGKGSNLMLGLILLVVGILLISPIVKALVTVLGWVFIIVGVVMLVMSAFRLVGRRR